MGLAGFAGLPRAERREWRMEIRGVKGAIVVMTLSSWHRPSLPARTRIQRLLTRVVCMAVALQLLAAPQLLAQGRQRGAPDLDTFMERLTERLELSEKQVAELRPIFKEQFQSMSALFTQRQRGDRESMRSVMRELRTKTDKRLAEVLTDEQMKKFREFREEQRRRRGGRRPPGALTQRIVMPAKLL